MWRKTGRLFDPREYGQTHAQMPVPLLLSDDRLRVYYSTRDGGGCSYCVYVDVNPVTMEILDAHTDPVIAKGKPGAFDDCGAMASSIFKDNGVYRLFYVGWNRCPMVRYRLAIGVASTLDINRPFVKVHDGPIMDRSVDDPYWVSSPCVIKGKSWYKMWYISCTGWQLQDEVWEPGYRIHHATSKDGVYWKPWGPCLKHRYAAARPCVLYHDGIYKMWYSHRALADYREDPSAAYRIGFATSLDGLSWRIGTPGIELSKPGWPPMKGWDSQMMCYPYVYEHGGHLHMLYSGNGFGAKGMGHAIWI